MMHHTVKDLQLKTVPLECSVFKKVCIKIEKFLHTLESQ